MRLALALLLLPFVAAAADSTRDGGTADYMCCSDKACTQVIVSKADAVRAYIECAKLTDADGVTRWYRSNAFKVTAKVVVVPPATTGSAALSWTTPTKNTDGSALTDLSGYRIVYGQDPSALAQSVQVGNVSTYTVQNLAAGTWYFAILTLTATNQSAPSNTASRAL